VTVDLGGAGVMHRTVSPNPAAALKQSVQGTVVVEVKLDASGNVSDAHVVTGRMSCATPRCNRYCSGT